MMCNLEEGLKCVRVERHYCSFYRVRGEAQVRDLEENPLKVPPLKISCIVFTGSAASMSLDTKVVASHGVASSHANEMHYLKRSSKPASNLRRLCFDQTVQLAATE